MLKIAIYVLFLALIIGLIQLGFVSYVKRTFNFSFPKRDVDTRISIKKLKVILKANDITNIRLLGFLKLIVALDLFVSIVFGIFIVLVLLFVFI